jgi:hypothetical protein
MAQEQGHPAGTGQQHGPIDLTERDLEAAIGGLGDPIEHGSGSGGSK